jgi:heme/copper-type cytochrome/quinol oxidase subunit 3
MTTYPTTTRDLEDTPELIGRNLRVGSRIWAAALAFFFISFLFAFFYLRALNSNGLWRGWQHISKSHPNGGPSPSLAFGIVILICVLASVAFAYGALVLPPAMWRPALAGSLALALAAVGLQCAQFSSLGFGPTDGGYASVFVGWTGLFTLCLFGTCYWLATVLAGMWRGTIIPALRVATVDAVAFVLLVLGLVEFAAFILLYIVE